MVSRTSSNALRPLLVVGATRQIQPRDDEKVQKRRTCLQTDSQQVSFIDGMLVRFVCQMTVRSKLQECLRSFRGDVALPEACALLRDLRAGVFDYPPPRRKSRPRRTVSAAPWNLFESVNGRVVTFIQNIVAATLGHAIACF